MKQYKVVAGPKNIDVGSGDIQSAFNVFADIINREVSGGWQYHSMENITVTQKAGCGRSATSTNFYMLIFEREA